MAPLSLKIVLDEGAVTRTIMFDSSTTVSEAHRIIKEKLPTGDDGKDYGLFLTSADEPLSGIWLESFRSLEYYMLRDGDHLQYLTRLRNLRVRMLDGTVKTLAVDESKSIGDLMLLICHRIGITNHDEYGLCHEEPESEEKEPKSLTGTLTLKRKAQQKERDAKMDQLSKKLKTDDNVEWLDQHKTLREMGVDHKETLLLKRRLFYSDRNVDSRDPVQLNLLYVQTRNAILDGRHPVTEDQVTDDVPTFYDKVNKTMMFNERQDVKLISLVQQNPVLYDHNNAKYMDFNSREVAWQRIGDEMKRPAADCKVRWINIRDVNRRMLRKTLSTPGQCIKHYKYENEMSFMRAYYKDVVIRTDNSGEYEYDDTHDEEQTFEVDDINIIQDDAASDEYEEKPIKKSRTRRSRKTAKRKKKVFKEESPEESEAQVFINESVTPSELDPTDPVDAFLLSIGATLKTFSPYHLNLAKSKIFSVVQEHDLQQIVQRQEHDAPSNDVKVSTSGSVPIVYLQQ